MIWNRITVKKLEKSTDEQIDRLLSEYVEKILLKPRPDERVYGEIQKIKPKIRAYYASGILDAEVRNGGFSQFLFNTSRYLIYDARYCYEIIGWQKHVSLIDQVLKHINPKQLSPEAFFTYLDSERGKALEEYFKGKEEAFHEGTEQFKKIMAVDKYDDKYYNISANQEIFPLLIRHLRANLADFVP